MFVGDAPGAVPLASEALALARQIRAPALIASGLLAVGLAVADTDPGQSRASLRESFELSTALGYQNSLGLLWRPGSPIASRTRPPRSSSAAVPFATSGGAVTAFGWASSST